VVWAARSRDRVAGTCRFDLVGPAHGTMATHALTIRCDRSDTTAPAGGAGKAPAGRRRAGVARVGVRSGATMLPR